MGYLNKLDTVNGYLDNLADTTWQMSLTLAKLVDYEG
jgi:hypothetical protein